MGELNTADIQFLVGKHLLQVAVGQHQVQLHFDDNVSISIECALCCAGVTTSDATHQGKLLIDLLGLVIVSGRIDDDDRLTITFGNGTEVTLIPDDPRFEAYSLWSPTGEHYLKGPG